VQLPGFTKWSSCRYPKPPKSVKLHALSTRYGALSPHDDELGHELGQV
jgi:hypothetical protein